MLDRMLTLTFSCNFFKDFVRENAEQTCYAQLTGLILVVVVVTPLAETWCKFFGRTGSARCVRAEFFCCLPNFAIWGRRRGTHCLLALNVGSVLSCIDAVYITIYFTIYDLTPDLSAYF